MASIRSHRSLPSQWSINDAGNELTLVIRDDLKVNTPEAFAGQDFGYVTAEDVAWNMNRQNAVVNPSPWAPPLERSSAARSARRWQSTTTPSRHRW